MKIARKDLLDKISYLKQEDLDNKVTIHKLKRLYAFKDSDSLLYRFYITLNLSMPQEERAYYDEMIERLEKTEQVKATKYLDKVLSP
jgi:hypothetical protein